jgi:GAF domain-containing protein
MVEEAGPNCYCDVHPIDWTGPIIEYSIAPSLPASYTDPIAGLSLVGDGLPCAIAVREKIQVVAEDIDTDPRWLDTPVRAHVLDHGLRSVWSTPIYARDGLILGTGGEACVCRCSSSVGKLCSTVVCERSWGGSNRPSSWSLSL